MSQKLKNKFFNTVSFKLTLWFAIIFVVFCFVVFTATYLMIKYRLDKQIVEHLSEEMIEMEILYNEGGIQKLRKEMVNEATPIGIDKEFFLILSTNAEIIVSTDLQYWPGLRPIKPQVLKAVKNKCLIKTVEIPYHNHRVKIATQKISDNIVAQIGISFVDNDRLLNLLSNIISLCFLILIILSIALGWFITNRAMNGVIRVTQTASKIKSGNLSHRVSIGREGNEIVNLAIVFNQMIEHIEVLVNELKNIANNIAHDLRTPITRIRGITETTLSGDETIENYREMAGVIVEECDSAASMIDTVLDIAEADTSTANFAVDDIDLRSILITAYELFQPSANEKQINITLDYPSSSVVIKGDSVKLQRVIANLIDNAVKYTPANGKVHLILKTDKTNIYLIVKNTGPGISQKDQSQIFKRFYRCDVSRTKQGNGLGLSLAMAIIKSLGGTITVRSNPNKFTVFTVILPLQRSL